MRILITTLAWISLATLGTFDVFGAYAANDLIVIVFGQVVTENTPKSQGALKFKELARLRLAGRVKVQVFPIAQLYGDNKVLQVLLLDDVKLAAPSWHGYIDNLLQPSGPILFLAIERNDSERANLQWD